MDLNIVNFDLFPLDKTVSRQHFAREYVQVNFLKAISDSDLKKIIVFKGGTALHMIYNMERYSEDLDFSLCEKVDPKTVIKKLKIILKDETITDEVVKYNTVLIETLQRFGNINFRVKFEINTKEVFQGELKLVASAFVPETFSIQVMKDEILSAQKICALINRKKARDIYDLWFMLKTKIPINPEIISNLLGVKIQDIPEKVEKRLVLTTDREIVSDLNAFISSKYRDWTRKQMIADTLQLWRTFWANMILT